ncbi:TLDc domain-containing protein [Entamoeba marina]
MEKVIQSDLFINFKQALPSLINVLRENDKNIDDSFEDKFDMKKLSETVEGSYEEIMNTCEERYGLIQEKIERKEGPIREAKELINQVEDVLQYLRNVTDKEEQELMEMKNSINDVVDKMIETEEVVINQQVNELKVRFETKKQTLLQKKLKQTELMHLNHKSIFPNDPQMQHIEKSMTTLQSWSGKRNCSVVFDSKVDSDLSQAFLSKVMNKSKLYFISFDDDNNVFGGYINTTVNSTEYITDKNAFVFSLLRKGELKYRRYKIKSGYHKQNAFKVYPTNSDYLYRFGYSSDGGDIDVFKINDPRSCCKPWSYEYKGTLKPLADDSTHCFQVQRIVVLQMN